MTDISAYPGVSTVWPSGYTAKPWSRKYVRDSVVAYLMGAGIEGLMSVLPAKTINWDATAANFYGDSQPFGVGAYIFIGKTTQGKLYTGNGHPSRTISHPVSLMCVFRSDMNDTAAIVEAQERIGDDMTDAIRLDPTLGGRVFQAGIHQLSFQCDTPQMDTPGHDVWFEITFDVEVISNLGA